jgi:manganese transport protein
VSMVIYTLATIAFYLLGAAVLNRKGLVVDNNEMVPTLSHMYRETFGDVGYWGYICGAVVVLYSTVFLATASNGRLFADLCGLFRWVKIRDDEHRAWLVKAACVGLTAVYFILFTNLKAPVTLVLVGALAQAMMLPFLGAAALYFLYRKTEPALKPGRLWVTLLWVSGLLMALMGGYQLWSTVTEMLKKHG